MAVTIIRRNTSANKEKICPPDAIRPVVVPKLATLASVLTKVEASALPSGAKRDIAWAIHAFARATGRTPTDIRADAAAIREHLASMSPAMLNLEDAAFHNLKANLRRGMRVAGTAVRSKTRRVALNANWATLYDQLPTRGLKARLGAFIAYCSAEGYKPKEISDGHVERYIHAQQADTIEPNWRNTVDRAVKAWNAAADELAFWPKAHLTPPWARREVFTLPLAAFTGSFRDSVSDYLGYLQDPPIEDDLAPLKPLRPGSIGTRLFRLRYLASTLVRAGWARAELTSVNDLVTPRALDILLEHKVPQKQGDPGSAQHLLLVLILKSIAKYWAASPKAVVDHLSRIINRYSVKQHSMAPRNKRKLATLSGEDVRAKLLNLPPEVFRALDKVDKNQLTPAHAALALAALYVEISLMCPARVGTLSKTHLTKNLIRSGHGRAERLHLHFEGEQMKNGMPLEAEMPPHLVGMLNNYIARYRPLLLVAPSDYLFPARNGGSRSCNSIYRSVTSITRRYVGVPVNPHFFRHVTATMFLERRPGDYETVRRALTHRSLDTAHRHYVGVDDRAAVRRFDDVILQAREEALPGRRRRRRVPLRKSARTAPARNRPIRQAAKKGGQS